MPRLIDDILDRGAGIGDGLERFEVITDPAEIRSAMVLVCDEVPAADSQDRIKAALGIHDKGPVMKIDPATYPFLAPLAPRMFLESYSATQWPNAGPVWWGALVFSVRYEDLDPKVRASALAFISQPGHYLSHAPAIPLGAWVQSWTLYLRKASQRAGALAVATFLVGPDGTWLDLVGLRTADSSGEGGMDEGQRGAVALGFLDPLMYGLSLAHCRNVRLVEGQRSRTDRRRAEREGKELVQFRQIVIDGTKAQRSSAASEPGTGAQRGQKAFHIVRGHFATYTQDAPLFGRHVGKFYHPAHTRGSTDAGVVTKEYVAKPRGGR